MIARLLWILPGLLFAIAIALVLSALDVRQTLLNGSGATAKVVEFVAESRAEITYGQVTVSVERPGRETIVEDVPLPLSLLYMLEGRDSVRVRLSAHEPPHLVVEDIARVQWHMSLIHAAMSLFGAVLLTIGVGAWNRYLRRNGDPARRTGGDA